MLTYEEMQYFAAFSESGTLTKVAEEYHISQPTITRAMKKAEEVFGVPLFERTKNSIRLNENGRMAAGQIRALLKQTDEMVRRVREFDRSCRTIAIGTSAAVPLPNLVGRLSRAFPDKAITTEMKLPEELLEGMRSNAYQMIILPYDICADEKMRSQYYSRKIGEEHLMFLLPKKHRFSRRKFLRLAELNGENILLYSHTGFWEDIVRKKMPDSRFLVQSERDSLSELMASSILPGFVTDLSISSPSYRIPADRVAIPIEDPEVNVTYYLVCRQNEKAYFAPAYRDE